MVASSLERTIEDTIERLGFELVELERAGNRTRPVLRLRIDRPDSQPGHGVSVDDCARVSRALEEELEERDKVPERYVLEVSSPGIERPLVKRRDFERFAGRDVALKGYGKLAERAKRLEGELLGVSGDGDEERIRVRLGDGEEISVPRREIARVNLVHRWE